MEKVGLEKIIGLARDFAKQKQKWHFHILTPECRLNESGRYALVVESVSDGESYICCSDEPYMGVGEKLVKLLHGDNVIKSTNEVKSEPSEQVSKLLERAGELSVQGVFWHHHMLFPGCRYNEEGDKWVILFEDMERGEIIRSVSEDEPKSDLQHIEGLFYAQRRDNETKD